MHELSIAEHIVSIASRHARGRPVKTVHVKVGHLRQVVPSALSFAFELLTEDGALQGARLDMEQIPARARCRGCGWEGALADLPFVCPACAGFDLDILEGEELFVESLELEEAPTAS